MNRIASISLLVSGVLLLCVCNSQTNTGNPIRKDVKEIQNVVQGAPTSLAIGDGSAKGTEISIPADALPEGSSLVLDRVDQPKAFSSAAGSNSKASQAIQISASSESGDVTQLSKPMTISIPFEGGAQLAAKVDTIVENLCALLTSEHGNFVWRYDHLNVDSTNKKVRFASKYLGIFQLYYCGKETIKGFEESETKANFINYSLTIDTDMYGFDADQVCPILVRYYPHEDDNEDSQHIPLAAIKAIDLDGTEQVVNYEYLESDLDSRGAALMALFFQKEGDPCDYEKGVNVDTEPVGDRIYLFRFSYEKTLAGEIGGTLGSGIYGLTRYYLKVGAPSGASFIPGTGKDMDLCIDSSRGNGSDDEDPNNWMEIKFSVAVDGLFSNNEDTYPVDLPEGHSAKFQMGVGDLCSDEDDRRGEIQEKGKAYAINLKDPVEDTFHVVPIQLNVSPPVPFYTGNMCVTVMPAGKLQGAINSSGGFEKDAVAHISIIPSQDTHMFMPWDLTGNGSVSAGRPVFDVMVSPDSTCRDGDGSSSQIQSVPKFGKTLSAQFEPF